MQYSEFIKDLESIPKSIETFIKINIDNFVHISKKIRELNPRLVLILGHGSSYSAGIYLSYIISKKLNIPSIQMNTSHITNDNITFSNERLLVISISKSGTTTDVVNATNILKTNNHTTLSITNGSNSELAKVTDYNINFNDSVETCAAFSKSHILSMVASLFFVAYWSDDSAFINYLLKETGSIEEYVDMFNLDYMDVIAKEQTVLIISDGIGMSCAAEISIKFKEMYRLHSAVCTANEFWHADDSHIRENDLILFIILNDACLQSTNNVRELTKKLKPKLISVEQQPSNKNNSNLEFEYYIAPIVCTYSIYKNLTEFETWNPHPCYY